MAQSPNLRVSKTDLKDKDWYINTIDWLITKAVTITDTALRLECINASNGVVDATVFKQTLNPYASGDVMKNLPGIIRDTDFITPIKEKNVGEYIVMPYKFFVTAENADLTLKRDAEIAKQVMDVLQTKVIEYITKAQTENQDIANLDLKSVVDKFKKELIDDMVIDAQNILKYINDFTHYDLLRYQAFIDYWTTQEFYTHRYIENGELYREALDVMNCYPMPNGNQFVEDFDGFVYKTRITFQEFKQHYSSLLTADEQEYLLHVKYDSRSGYYSAPVHLIRQRGNLDTFYTSDSNNEVHVGSEVMDLWKVWFIAEEEVQELKYIDSLNRLQYMHVDKNYKLNPDNNDLEINTIWKPKVYVAYRFGNDTTGIYVAPEELTVQRYDRRNNTVKLPIGGLKGLYKNKIINPIPKRLEPYLVIDRILLLNIERGVAKIKNNLLALPQGILNPDAAGTTLEKLQHMIADDTLIYDESAIDINVLTNGLRMLNRNSDAAYITTLWQLRANNKAEALEVANMNAERLGFADNNQTATNTNTNLTYAKLGSVLMITMFNSALEVDHIADLEYSKYAFINGKTLLFFDKSTETHIEKVINPIEHFYNKYGVTVSNAKINEDILNKFADVAFNASQNGEFDLASIAITATSPIEISKKLEEISEAKRAFDQQLETKKLQLLEEQNNLLKEQIIQKDRLQDKDDAANIKVAQITANARQRTT